MMMLSNSTPPSHDAHPSARSAHDVAPEPQRNRRITRALLGLAGCALLAMAIVYNELTMALLAADGTLAAETIVQVRWTQVIAAGTGGGLLLLAALGKGMAGLARVLSRPAAPRIALLGVALVLPLFALELALRPVARFPNEGKTTIFVEDEDLGWRMRPGVEGVWGGQRVRINGKGLRGPELDYAKPVGTRRVLFLGDSVTFGSKLANDEDTFPPQVASLLGEDVEGINGGVGGYSPWQHLAYLERDGIRYQPDLVVVGFVLNDVTEKMGLTRFGGTGQGFQLESSTSRAVALVYDLSRVSAIAHFARKLSARIRFGPDPQEGAKQKELLDVESLVRDPDRPAAERAWRITLENLERLIAFCQARGVPAALVVFPFTFQFEDPEGLSAPQRRLTAFANERGVPVLDLLPPLAAAAREESLTPEDFFVDEDHLSVRGSQTVAALIADFIRREALLAAAAADAVR